MPGPKSGESHSKVSNTVVEREGDNFKGSKDIFLKNGSSQGQNLTLTVLFVTLSVLFVTLNVLFVTLTVLFLLNSGHVPDVAGNLVEEVERLMVKHSRQVPEPAPAFPLLPAKF